MDGSVSRRVNRMSEALVKRRAWCVWCRRGALWGRRVFALSAVGSAALHLWVALDAPGRILVGVVTTAAMAAACLGCASHLWTRGGVRSWTLAVGVNIGMVGSHLILMAIGREADHGHGAIPGHFAHAMTSSGAIDSSLTSPMSIALAISAIEAVIAGVVLYSLSRPAGG